MQAPVRRTCRAAQSSGCKPIQSNEREQIRTRARDDDGRSRREARDRQFRFERQLARVCWLAVGIRELEEEALS